MLLNTPADNDASDWTRDKAEDEARDTALHAVLASKKLPFHSQRRSLLELHRMGQLIRKELIINCLQLVISCI